MEFEIAWKGKHEGNDIAIFKRVNGHSVRDTVTIIAVTSFPPKCVSDDVTSVWQTLAGYHPAGYGGFKHSHCEIAAGLYSYTFGCYASCD